MTRFAPTFLLVVLVASPLAAQTDPPDIPAWALTQLDGADPGFEASIALDQPGMVRGRGPCNRFTAPQNAVLPDFRVDAIMSTKMACPHSAAEQQFFDLLSQMDQAEQSDSILILTGAGHRLVFSSLP